MRSLAFGGRFQPIARDMITGPVLRTSRGEATGFGWLNGDNGGMVNNRLWIEKGSLNEFLHSHAHLLPHEIQVV